MWSCLQIQMLCPSRILRWSNVLLWGMPLWPLRFVFCRWLQFLRCRGFCWLLLCSYCSPHFGGGLFVAPLCFNYSKFHGRKQGFFGLFLAFFRKNRTFPQFCGKPFSRHQENGFLILNFERCLFPAVVCSRQVIMVTLAYSVDELRVEFHCVADSSELLAC